MSYLISISISILSVVFVLAIQSCLSILLIKTGHFNASWYFFGGVVILPLLAYQIMLHLLRKVKNKVQTKAFQTDESNHKSHVIAITIIPTLLVSLWVMIKVTDFHEKYEYETFGIKEKGIITKKVRYQNGVIYYYYLLGKSRQIKEISLGGYRFTKKNVGDTILILSTPRYPSMIKFLEE